MKDITGNKFDRWEVISFSHKGGHNGRVSYWKVKCLCGIEKIVRGDTLTKGQSKSCGCLQKETVSKIMKFNEHSKKIQGDPVFNHCYNSYKGMAKHKGREFNINQEEFKILTSSNCHYCGAEPSNISTYKYPNSKTINNTYIYNGIDRVNSDKGYTIDNVVPCCKICNKAKLDMSLVDFKIWIDKLTHYNLEEDLPSPILINSFY